MPREPTFPQLGEISALPSFCKCIFQVQPLRELDFQPGGGADSLLW